jgi:urea transport system permease protein
MSSQAASVLAPARSETPLEVETPRISNRRAYWRLACFLLFVAALFLPGFYMDPGYRLPKFNRFMALALYALSVDLIWGYTGLLSLGQGLYFGIGGYIVGYSLILQKAALEEDKPRYLASPDMALPPFMFQNRLEEVPTWIAPLIDIWLAIALALLIPMVIAALFGWVVFQRRIKGVYFSLITQAVVLSMFHLVTNQMPYTGGEGGLYNLATLELFGFDFLKPSPIPMYLLTTGFVAFFALACYALMHSKMGKVLTAIRDNEFRVMALGYNTAMYKTFIFTLAGLMAGLAGALFVAGNRTAGPTFFSIGESIEVVILVAVGGRGTLAGPILGALLVSEGKDFINEKFRDIWPIILGGMFMSVVLFMPEGILGGIPRFFKFLRIWFYRRPGLTKNWNTVRVGVGLMYWGIVLTGLAVALRIIIGITTTSGDADSAAEPQLFVGVVGSILYWLIMAGSLMALVGQCICWVAPPEIRGKKFVFGSVVSLGIFVLLGLVAIPVPLAELRSVFALRGFGDSGPILIGLLVCAATVSYLLFTLFLRGVALFYQNETLARSASRFCVLFALFLACTVLLNTLSASVWSVADYPITGRLLFLLRLTYIAMALVVPLWFLRLLYQTHEGINRPLTSF